MHSVLLSDHDPAAGHRRPTPPPETPGHSRASLGQSLVRALLLLVGPGAHKVLFVSAKSLFSQSCVSSGSSMVGLKETSSKRAYVTPKSAAPRASAPVAGHCWPIPSQETLKQSKACLAPSLWGLLVNTRFCLSLLSISDVWGLILYAILPLRLSCWGFSFAIGCGVSFFLVGSNILLSMVVLQRVVILEFSQEKMSACPSTPPSWSGITWLVRINYLLVNWMLKHCTYFKRFWLSWSGENHDTYVLKIPQAILMYFPV